MLLGIVVLVGITLGLPQLVGFAASRRTRRLSPIIWPLAAAAMVAIGWAIITSLSNCPTGGELRCEINAPLIDQFALFLAGVHLVLGGVLGLLDARARRHFGANRRAGRGDSPSAR